LVEVSPSVPLEWEKLELAAVRQVQASAFEPESLENLSVAAGEWQLVVPAGLALLLRQEQWGKERQG
jgi:hypothetical protein